MTRTRSTALPSPRRSERIKQRRERIEAENSNEQNTTQTLNTGRRVASRRTARTVNQNLSESQRVARRFYQNLESRHHVSRFVYDLGLSFVREFVSKMQLNRFISDQTDEEIHRHQATDVKP